MQKYEIYIKLPNPKITLILISFFAVCSFTACVEPDEPLPPPPIDELLPNFQGTYWKLAGYFEETGDTLHIFERQEENSCYYFIFDTDSTAFGRVVGNYLQIHLFYKYPITIPTLMMDSEDAELFRQIVKAVTTCSYNIDEIKFSCKDKSYLLFERRDEL